MHLRCHRHDLKLSSIQLWTTEAVIPTTLSPIEELCSQTEGLYIEDNKEAKKKAKKKAKAKEIARLTKLGLKGVMEEAKPLKDVQFKPFLPGDHRAPKLNIPSNIDTTDPLALLDLFIPPEIYTTIAENTNLYTIVCNAPITRSSTNSRYWWPTNENEICVLFGILYYMGVHREPNYKIYWETPKPNGPIHAIPKHMSFNRYENLRHYLYVSSPKRPDSQMETQQPLEPLQACPEAQEAQAYPEVQEAQACPEAQEAQACPEAQEAQACPEAQEAQKPPLPCLEDPEEEEEQWWWRLEPILDTFHIACQTYLIPETEVAINEIMVRFHRRSSNTLQDAKQVY
jgi:hypothetical protein